MCVPGGDSETMIDDHQAAVACMVLRDGDDSIRRGMNRSAVIRRHIYACVECTLTAEWIQALAEAIRNVPHDRPDRRGCRSDRTPPDDTGAPRRSWPLPSPRTGENRGAGWCR